MVNRTQALAALLLVMGLLSLATLACTSDQEWIIPRTPTPTLTPTPAPITLETAFQIGDRAKVVGVGFSTQLTQNPEPSTGRNNVLGSNCFLNQEVEILDVAENNGEIFYRVDCILEGWISENYLEPVG